MPYHATGAEVLSDDDEIPLPQDAAAAKEASQDEDAAQRSAVNRKREKLKGVKVPSHVKLPARSKVV